MQTESQRAPRILVVDDNAQLLAAINLGLSRHGFEVCVAESGDQAKAIIEDGVVPDLLLTDAVMPGDMQGPDLVRYFKNHFPDSPAVLMSAYLGTDQPISRGNTGADRMVAKPFEIGDLAGTLWEHLAQRAR